MRQPAARCLPRRSMESGFPLMRRSERTAQLAIRRRALQLPHRKHGGWLGFSAIARPFPSGDRELREADTPSGLCQAASKQRNQREQRTISDPDTTLSRMGRRVDQALRQPTRNEQATGYSQLCEKVLFALRPRQRASSCRTPSSYSFNRSHSRLPAVDKAPREARHPGSPCVGLAVNVPVAHQQALGSSAGHRAACLGWRWLQRCLEPLALEEHGERRQ